jgi:hypothetical protein
MPIHKCIFLFCDIIRPRTRCRGPAYRAIAENRFKNAVPMDRQFEVCVFGERIRKEPYGITVVRFKHIVETMLLARLRWNFLGLETQADAPALCFVKERQQAPVVRQVVDVVIQNTLDDFLHRTCLCESCELQAEWHRSEPLETRDIWRKTGPLHRRPRLSQGRGGTALVGKDCSLSCNPDIHRARRLRSMTNAQEQLAWDALRKLRPLGFPVRRQHPSGGYFVDFAIVIARLVIEIDGSVHESAGARCRTASGHRTARLARVTDRCAGRDEPRSCVFSFVGGIGAVRGMS